MINNNAEVYKILSKIAKTEQYAIDFNENTEYPCISFSMKGNDDISFADGKPRAAVYEVEVEVYQKRINGEMKEIHFDVANAMKAESYSQVFYDYIFDDEQRIFNHILRFEKVIEYWRGDNK